MTRAQALTCCVLWLLGCGLTLYALGWLAQAFLAPMLGIVLLHRLVG